MMDPDAKKRLQAAAEAAGLSLAELVDLVHDSGALSVDPESASDGITSSVTLKDLGMRMWGELQKVATEERTAWFRELLEPQQVALVVTLSDQRFRPEVIGRELGLTSVRVREILNAYADRIGFQVTQIRLSTIAGHVQLAAERAMEGLLAKEDFKAYFAVQKEVVGLLQSLGIVDQAIQKLEVTHKTEETMNETQRNIEAMIDVERKRQIRIEEIARANQEDFGDVPELEFEKED